MKKKISKSVCKSKEVWTERQILQAVLIRYKFKFYFFVSI